MRTVNASKWTADPIFQPPLARPFRMDGPLHRLLSRSFNRESKNREIRALPHQPFCKMARTSGADTHSQRLLRALTHFDIEVRRNRRSCDLPWQNKRREPSDASLLFKRDKALALEAGATERTRLECKTVDSTDSTKPLKRLATNLIEPQQPMNNHHDGTAK